MKTLSQYLAEYEREHPKEKGIRAAIEDIAKACWRISDLVGRGALIGIHGNAGEQNVQGEDQQKLDILSNQIMLDMLAWSGNWAGLGSEEMENIYHIPSRFPKGKYLCLFDPLDGSGNIDLNMPIGTIFSVLPYKKEGVVPLEEDFLQPGKNQVAAGYVLYGASTTMNLTLGRGVHSFTFDRHMGEFCLTELNIKMKEETSKFSINMSNYRHWEQPVRQYIDECLEGESGVRGKNFNMRWMGCMVADSHRSIIRSGVFMYPYDTKDSTQPAKLRLMYEANPMSMIVEQAGGKSTTGTENIMDIIPTELHQRVPVIMGSRNEIDYIVELHKKSKVTKKKK